jgi:far upstream element-binding protein
MRVISRVVLVPNDQVGRLIGKGGCTIRQMQEISGCHVEIAKSCPPGSTLREVTVTGGEAQISRAIQLVQQKLSGLPLIASSGAAITPVQCIRLPLSTPGLQG